jgi:hypothetical protein
MTGLILLNRLDGEHRRVINEAVEAGHVDPTLAEHYEQAGCMLDFKMSKGERRFLQFYKEFGTIDPSKLQRSQVRKFQIDQDNVQKIRADLEAGKGLDHPIVTKKISGQAEKIIHGHHRVEAWKLAFPGKPIPRFIISDEMLEVLHDEAGEEDYKIADKIAYRQLRSAIAPNPRNPNKEYNMEDIANHVTKAIAADPTLDGLKGADDPLDREMLGVWMDEFVPGYFPDESTRGKILAAYNKGDAGSQVKPMKEGLVKNLVSEGWDPTPQDWLDWYDPKAKALQGYVPWRESNEPMYGLFSRLAKAYYLGKHDKLKSYIKNGCVKIHLYVEIYTRRKEFSPNLPSLQADRASALKAVKEMNELLYKCGIPFQIVKVLFPDQLTQAKDAVQVKSLRAYTPPKPPKTKDPETRTQEQVH